MYSADPNQFSDEIRMNLPDRLDVYLSSNYETVQFSVTQYASQVARDLGVYPINMKLPILSELYTNRFSQMFLGIILNMIIVILFLLSVFLLYNLLLISVETKTYEMGVLRVLGFNKAGVVFLILT
jgi:ABC-type antimicrobial peptide transport system permease subunit